MRTLIFTCDKDGINVKSVLKNQLCLASSVITALKNTGGILLNGKVVTVRATMNCGDELKMIIPEVDSDNISKTKGDLQILFEDDDILCVNKPSGMPTHPSQNHHNDTLANIVCYYYRNTPFVFRVSNRLDSYTSGVVIIAKNMYSASFLCTNEFRKTMKKTYYAICRGFFEGKKGTITAPIARCDGSTIKREVSPGGQYAETYYEVVEERDDVSIVKLQPKTGRTHQIRVHMAYMGHPLMNDFLYDDKYDEKSHFYLHCHSITFEHPLTKKAITVEAPLPDGFN